MSSVRRAGLIPRCESSGPVVSADFALTEPLTNGGIPASAAVTFKNDLRELTNEIVVHLTVPREVLSRLSTSANRCLW